MQDIKHFNMRVPKEMWLFLKDTAAKEEVSMMEIVLCSLKKYKKNYEKRLTSSDADV